MWETNVWDRGAGNFACTKKINPIQSTKTSSGEGRIEKRARVERTSQYAWTQPVETKGKIQGTRPKDCVEELLGGGKDCNDPNRKMKEKWPPL